MTASYADALARWSDGYWAARKDYDPQPAEMTLLRPPFAKLRAGRAPEDYDEALAALFAELRED